MTSSRRGRRTVWLACCAALGVAFLSVVLCRKDIAEWLYLTPDPLGETVTLRFDWDQKGVVRCETRPYLRSNGIWLDVHEFSMDPGVKRSPAGGFRTRTAPTDSTVGGANYDYGIPNFREIEDYLEFRKRERTPLFGDPGRLAVLVTFDRRTPWKMVVNILDVCKKLGITEIDIDEDD